LIGCLDGSWLCSCSHLPGDVRRGRGLSAASVGSRGGPGPMGEHAPYLEAAHVFAALTEARRVVADVGIRVPLASTLCEKSPGARGPWHRHPPFRTGRSAAGTPGPEENQLVLPVLKRPGRRPGRQSCSPGRCGNSSPSACLAFVQHCSRPTANAGRTVRGPCKPLPPLLVTPAPARGERPRTPA